MEYTMPWSPTSVCGYENRSGMNYDTLKDGEALLEITTSQMEHVLLETRRNLGDVGQLMFTRTQYAQYPDQKLATLRLDVNCYYRNHMLFEHSLEAEVTLSGLRDWARLRNPKHTGPRVRVPKNSWLLFHPNTVSVFELVVEPDAVTGSVMVESVRRRTFFRTGTITHVNNVTTQKVVIVGQQPKQDQEPEQESKPARWSRTKRVRTGTLTVIRNQGYVLGHQDVIASSNINTKPGTITGTPDDCEDGPWAEGFEERRNPRCFDDRLCGDATGVQSDCSHCSDKRKSKKPQLQADPRNVCATVDNDALLEFARGNDISLPVDDVPTPVRKHKNKKPKKLVETKLTKRERERRFQRQLRKAVEFRDERTEAMDTESGIDYRIQRISKELETEARERQLRGETDLPKQRARYYAEAMTELLRQKRQCQRFNEWAERTYSNPPPTP